MWEFPKEHVIFPSELILQLKDLMNKELSSVLIRKSGVLGLETPEPCAVKNYALTIQIYLPFSTKGFRLQSH